VGHGSGGGAGGADLEGCAMSGIEGLAWAMIGLGSIYASFRLGQMNILERFRRHHERRKERELRWREFEEDFED
jgi:hypothetical protein